jgi:hypothetical protein
MLVEKDRAHDQAAIAAELTRICDDATAISERTARLVAVADGCTDEAEVGRMLVFAHELELIGGFIVAGGVNVRDAALARGLELRDEARV